MRNITLAITQMACSDNIEENINNAEQMVREAAGKGANVVLVHHQGFERRGESSETLRNGGLSALPVLTYPRNYP